MTYLPDLVGHADWGSSPRKRCLALALKRDGSYWMEAPRLAGNLDSLVPRLRQAAGPDGCTLLGFDFPIGLPLAYARQTGIDDFLTCLPLFGKGVWSDFYRVAATPGEISFHRPFYPSRPGSARQHHLLDSLGLKDFDGLRRLCEKRVPAHSGNPGRRAACPLFWTLGGQQVGKAAILGWQTVLAPALREASQQNQAEGFGIWPFSGALADLLAPGRLIAAEIYPAECYLHLGITFSPHRPGTKSGKRVQAERKANTPAMLAWARESGVRLTEELQNAIQNGFGASPDGEDAFDATIGLMGMLNVLLGFQPSGEPQDEQIRRIEGWILGMQPV